MEVNGNRNQLVTKINERHRNHWFQNQFSIPNANKHTNTHTHTHTHTHTDTHRDTHTHTHTHTKHLPLQLITPVQHTLLLYVNADTLGEREGGMQRGFF